MDSRERTFLALEHKAGEELYVISGELVDGDGRYPSGTWFRNPKETEQIFIAVEESLIWLKTGHF